MNLVTGKKSSAHVSSDDFRKIVESLVGGGGSFVSSVGNGLQASVSGTTLSIGKGVIVHHGCVFETSNSGDTVSFQAGSSGMNRIDLICVKYTRNNSTGIEDASWNVLQGTSTSGTPSQPSVPSGDLRNDNATQDYCPVFKLTLNGNTPTVQLLLNTIPINDAYYKPSTGIPSSDMASAVQSSLQLANRASQINLVYENPSPSSSFLSGNVINSNNLGSYNASIVVYKVSTTDNNYFSEFITKGVSVRSTSFWNYRQGRTCTLSSNGITFGAGYSSSSATVDMNENNLACIPYRIYGVKIEDLT